MTAILRTLAEARESGIGTQRLIGLAMVLFCVVLFVFAGVTP